MLAVTVTIAERHEKDASAYGANAGVAAHVLHCIVALQELQDDKIKVVGVDIFSAKQVTVSFAAASEVREPTIIEGRLSIGKEC